MTAPTTCPLLDDLTARLPRREPGPFAEMGRRAAAETCRMLDARVDNMIATRTAIARVSGDLGFVPPTRQEIYDSIGASMAAYSLDPATATRVGPVVGLSPGLGQALQPRSPNV